MEKNTNYITWIIVVLIIVGFGAFIVFRPDPVGADYTAFAECLGEKGATFYGAFWCQHCAEQKALFGKAVSSLPYTECSTPDGRGQLPLCTEKGVESYPTWDFADGERLTGVIPLAELAEKTACELPVVEPQ